GNVETFSMYAGLGLLFFFLVLYLQQVAGYNAVEAGTTPIPVTLMMFLFSTRFGALADRHGPRFFMGFGPLIAAVGLAMFLRLDANVDYLTDLLPGLLVFALGLSMTVAPLTATVLADADEHNAAIRSGVNNAIARVGPETGRPENHPLAQVPGKASSPAVRARLERASTESSVDAFRMAIGIAS